MMKAVDMHCDTISALLEKRKEDAACTLDKNDLHISLARLEQGDYQLQSFALFVNAKDGCDPFLEAVKLADCFDEQMRSFPDRITQVKSFEDIEKASAEGKIGALLTVEEGAVCEGSLEKLRALYDRGVRMLTLTWNYPNEIGWPNFRMPEKAGMEPDFLTPETEKGLTEFGFAFVEEMERLGMIADVSHLSDAGFYDVLRSTKKPFAASHSNARAVCPVVRNLSDDMIRALSERGGVMGLNFCPDFLEQPAPGRKNGGTIEAVTRHAKHIVNTGGIECLGLGSDFDGIPTHEELKGADCLPLLEHALAKAGFTGGQREKIFSGNVLRLYRETL